MRRHSTSSGVPLDSHICEAMGIIIVLEHGDHICAGMYTCFMGIIIVLEHARITRKARLTIRFSLLITEDIGRVYRRPALPFATAPNVLLRKATMYEGTYGIVRNVSSNLLVGLNTLR